MISVIHQTHDYSHCLGSKRGKGPEARKNLELAGGFSHTCTLLDADWVLTRDGLKRPMFPRSIFAKLSLFPFWRQMLSIARKLRSLFCST